MSLKYAITRRQFIAASAALAVGTTLPGRATPVPQVVVFSKHLQFLDYPNLARTCRELGLDGVDLTVRLGGHVLPENVERDLPAAVEAIRGEGLEVPMITTRLMRADEPHAEATIKTAAGLGIKFFRVGGHKYAAAVPIPEQLATFADDCRTLAELAGAHGMTAGYHNHSGPDEVGAPLWDLYQIYQQVGSPHLGSNLDLGHATVEGPYGDWEITTRALAPHVKMAAVKDFVFERNKPKWVPLGEGVVPLRQMLTILRKAEFSGPISIHLEYKLESNERLLEDVAAAAVTLRRELRRAGYEAPGA